MSCRKTFSFWWRYVEILIFQRQTLLHACVSGNRFLDVCVCNGFLSFRLCLHGYRSICVCGYLCLCVCVCVCVCVLCVCCVCVCVCVVLCVCVCACVRACVRVRAHVTHSMRMNPLELRYRCLKSYSYINAYSCSFGNILHRTF